MVAQSLGAWAPAIVTFAAVMLGTLALALLWQWWIERRRRRNVVEQLRSFAARSSGDQAASRTLIRGVESVEARWLQSRSEEHTSELQSRLHLVCRLLLEKKKNNTLSCVHVTNV